jgi:rhodanese-related sulfurtransferase
MRFTTPFAFMACLLFFAATAVAQEAVMSADEAAEKAAKGEVMIIDVRSPQEWAETGVPAGAKRVTIHNPEGVRAFVEEVVKITDGDTSQPIAFICAAGVRSSYAQQLVEDAGYENVVNIREGMMGSSDGPGWLAKGLPTDDCGAC